MASVAGTQVTVTTSPTALMTLDKVRTAVTLLNQHATASVYVGDSAVTTAGFELKAGAALAFNAPPNFQVYAVTASSTARVDVAEIET